MAKEKSSTNPTGNSLDPFRMDSFYSKTVTEENRGQVGLYPKECNGSDSTVPSSMQGETRNIQAGP